MLTDCLTLALKGNVIGEEDWYLTDEALLRFLLEQPEMKDVIKRFAIGDFYHQLFLGWYACPKGDIDLRHPDHRTSLTESLKDRIKIPCSPYVFYDSGTFAKNLALSIKHDTRVRTVTISTKSQSTIVAVFTPRRITSSEHKRMSELVVGVLEEYGLRSSCLIEPPDKGNMYEVPGQRTISFGA